jgi:hypothetical protein
MRCAEAGFAPRFVSISAISPSWHAVIMEALDLRRFTHSDVQIVDQLNDLYEFLVSNSYVHGDMRENNILVENLSGRLILINFDWAGIAGEATYPPFINSDICWPQGASSGMRITHDHDHYWISKYLNIFQP